MILGFFEKYPEFKGNDLYLSGESYGGIYVPYMAYYIDKHNTANDGDDSVYKPNLKGFAVGNGVTNWDYDTTPAYLEMGYGHSLYDTNLYEEMQKLNCDYGGSENNRMTTECEVLLDEFSTYTEFVNVYDIFGTCWGRGSAPQHQKIEGINADFKPKKDFVTSADYTPWLKRKNNQS